MAEPTDPQLDHALLAAQRLAEADPRLTLHPDDSPAQGKNNRVVACAYDGRRAILKHYDHGRAEATSRRGREVFFLRHHAGSGVVPALLHAETNGPIVIERLPGSALDRLYGDATDTRAFIASTFASLGRAHAALRDVGVARAESADFESAFLGGRSLDARLADRLGLAKAWCSAVPRLRDVGGPSLRAIASRLPTVLAGPPRFYLHDQNPSNVLIDGDGRVGLIDFEMCDLGNDWVMLGATFDCMQMHAWDARVGEAWRAFLKGFRERSTQAVDVLDPADLAASAALHHWWRVCRGQPQADSPWMDRFVARFERYNRMLAM